MITILTLLHNSCKWKLKQQPPALLRTAEGCCKLSPALLMNAGRLPHIVLKFFTYANRCPAGRQILRRPAELYGFLKLHGYGHTG
jgi:hypothetical protein